MALLTAKSIYLIITFVVAAALGVTGAYYYTDLKKNEKLAQNNTPTPSASPQTVPSTPEPTLAPTLAVCMQSCEFSFQCDGELECLDNNGKKVCSNPTCPSDDSCSCTQSKTATSSARPKQPLAQYTSEASPSAAPVRAVGGAVTPTPKPTVKPTVKPTATPSPSPTLRPTATPKASPRTPEVFNTMIDPADDAEPSLTEDEAYDPQLPEAGIPLVSYVVIALAIITTASGLWWLNKRTS